MYSNNKENIDVIKILNLHKKLQDQLLAAAKKEPSKFTQHNINVMNLDKEEIRGFFIENIDHIENKEKMEIKDYLNLRNQKNIIYGNDLKVFYCCLCKGNIENQAACFMCEFGHLTECHFPFDCNSNENCNHYAGQREFEKQAGYINISDGLDSYRRLKASREDNIMDLLLPEAKKILEDINNYSEYSEDEPICVRCKKKVINDVPIRFSTPDGKLEAAFHIQCCLNLEAEPDNDLVPADIDQELEEEF